MPFTKQLRTLVCPKCNTEFSITERKFRDRQRKPTHKIYCSRSCWIESKFRLPRTVNCHQCGVTIRVHGRLKKFCSIKCRGLNYRGRSTNKGYKWPAKSRASRSGKNSNLWKGGRTETSQLIRSSFEYKAWRTQVFERDDYTCQLCGERAGKLEADHIKPFSVYPSLRLKLTNGRTLCRSCHKKTPTYGRRATSTQLRSLKNRLYAQY